MTCPKCRSDVPDAARRCPGCGLRKPKARLAKRPEEEAIKWVASIQPQPATPKRSPASSPSKAKRTAIMLSVAMTFAVLAASAYWFVAPFLHSKSLEPKTAQMVLENLRKMPSNQEGLTVEESVARELERSRRVGNLVSYQGWTVHQAPEDRSKLLVVFSFNERDNTQQRAEWLADPVSSTFVPQTELAAAVFKR